MRIRPAIALALLGVLVVGIGRIFGLLEMYVIGTGLAATSVLAVVWTRTRVVLVAIERRPSLVEPEVGDDVDIELRTRATRRSPSFDLRDHVSDPSRSSLGRVDISVPALRRGTETVSRYRIRPEQRGVVTLGPATSTCGDPLGLTRRMQTVGGTDEIVVTPRWNAIALPVPRACEGELVSAIENLTRNSAADLEFRSIREYAPGDDARLVNWRATARRDSLVINEFESRTGILLDVFLDDSSVAFSTDGFESAVSVAASFVGSTTSVDEEDLRVRLSFGSRTDASSFDALIDDETRREAMRRLAMLSVSDREPQVRGAHSRALVSIPVLIHGRRSLDWLERAHRAMRGSSIAVVVACDGEVPARLPERWFAVQAPDIDSFTRDWAVLSRTIRVS